MSSRKDWFVYWLSYSKEEAIAIQNEIANKTGLLCQIGYLTPRNKKQMTTIVECPVNALIRGKIDKSKRKR